MIDNPLAVLTAVWAVDEFPPRTRPGRLLLGTPRQPR